MKIGVVGAGYVGTATRIFACDKIEVISYDLDPEKCIPEGTTLSDVRGCDLIFVSVPTPMNKDGSCHTKIVEGAVKELRKEECGEIVVRSTVPVGTCKRLKTHFMPEFLTERNFIRDVKDCSDWIFGIHEFDMDKKIIETFKRLLVLARESEKITSTSCHFCTTDIAELVKLTRNTFLATKVSFFNEIKDFCDRKEVGFDAVRKLVCLDERVGTSHTEVPGPDQKRGYGGTCFPKDINSCISNRKFRRLGPRTNTDEKLHTESRKRKK
jgi:nucleotide sugar dehydrogenase